MTRRATLRGLGPKGARVALAAGIARQFYETARGSVFFEEHDTTDGMHVVVCGFCLFVFHLSLCGAF